MLRLAGLALLLRAHRGEFGLARRRIDHPGARCAPPSAGIKDRTISSRFHRVMARPASAPDGTARSAGRPPRARRRALRSCRPARPREVELARARREFRRSHAHREVGCASRHRNSGTRSARSARPAPPARGRCESARCCERARVLRHEDGLGPQAATCGAGICSIASISSARAVSPGRVCTCARPRSSSALCSHTPSARSTCATSRP